MRALLHGTRRQRLIQAWWLQLPLRVARFFPTVGRTLSDGLYLAHWPTVAATAPLITLGLAFLLGALHPGETFTYSSLVMGMMMAVGLLSLQLGGWALLGYAMGDFLLHYHAGGWSASLGKTLGMRLSLLLSYILLALAVMGVPLVGAAIRLRLRSFILPIWPRLLVEAVGYVTVVGVLVYLWARAIPVLIRPVFTWQGGQPSVADIRPLQEGAGLLIGVAVSSALVRLLLEGVAASPQVASLAQLSSLAFPPVTKRRSPLALSRSLVVGASALLLTFLMAGLLSHLFEGLLVFVFLATLLWARDRIQQTHLPLCQLLARVPLPLRFAAGLALSYAISWLVLTVLWETTQTFRPALIATCLSVAILTLLVGVRGPIPSRGEKTGGR